MERSPPYTGTHWSRRALRGSAKFLMDNRRALTPAFKAAVSGVKRKLFQSSGEQPKKRVKKSVGRFQSTQAHSGISHETIRIRSKARGKAKRNKKTFGKWEYHIARTGFITSPAGEQGAQELNFFCTPNQMCSGVTVALPDTVNSDIGLLDLNPYQKSTGSRILAASNTPSEDRFYLKGFNCDVEITNFSTVGAIVDIYLLKAKKTDSLTPITTWNNGYANEAFGQISTAQPAAGAPLAGTVGGFGNVVDPGAKPMDSPQFKKLWTVVTVKSLTMVGGATEKLDFDVYSDKIMKRDLQTTYISNGNVYVAGQVYCIMSVARGALVTDITDPANPFVTYGSTKLGYILNTHYHACAVKDQAARLNTNRAYIPITFGAASTKQTSLNEIDIPITVAAGTT